MKTYHDLRLNRLIYHYCHNVLHKKIILGILAIVLIALQQASAQESNCTNHIDDDSDGLIDCADNNCNCSASAYSCDSKYYILRANATTTSSTDLIQVNISTTGVVTLVNQFTYTQTLNALGYFKGYLYAMASSGTTLYRLDKLGNIVSLGTPTGLPSPAANWSGAAITRAGIMYIIEGRTAGDSGQRRLYSINLLPGGSYTATLIGNTGVAENVGDMAIDELGTLYGFVEERNGVASNNAGLYTLNVTNAAATRISTIPYTYSSLASMFYSLNGFTGKMFGYGHDNDPTRTQNTFYEVNYLGTGSLTTLSTSTGVSRSDGCSCPWKLSIPRYADIECIAAASTFNWHFDFNNNSGSVLSNITLRDTIDTRFSYSFNVATTQTAIRAIYGNAATVTLGNFGGGTNNVLTITGLNIPMDYTSLTPLAVTVSSTAIFTLNQVITEQAYATGLPTIYSTYIKTDYPYPPLNGAYDIPDDASPLYAIPSWSASNTGPYCTGATIQLSATTGFSSYSWSGPNAFTSTISTPTRASATIAMSGTYTIGATDANNCYSERTTTVSVSSATTTISPATATICNGTSQTLTASGGGSYVWSNAATTAAITVSPTTTTTYTVTTTATNGCTAMANSVITVNANPTVNITGTATICSGASTTLSANVTAGSGTITTYTWSNGQSGSTQTSISVSTAGTYVVTITNSNGCTATASRVLTVNTTPTAGIILAETSGVANNDGIICAGSSVQLTGTSGATYAWSGTAIGTPSANPQNILPTTTGTYTLTVSSATGCTATASQLITVNALPIAVIVPGGGGTVCNTQSGLTLTASGGATYSWSTGATTAAINIASTQATTTYVVTVTNSNNCSATTNVTVNAVGTGGCNQVPIAINDINNTFTNTPISGQVLTNDSAPDAGQTLTVNTPPSGVSGGTVILNSDGTYTFTPTTGLTGVGQFTYTVCDNGSPQACDQATVYINITANTSENNPPAPGKDVIQTSLNTTVSGTVANNDIDPDGNLNPSSFTLTTPPTTGVLSFNNDGTFSFVPATGFVGTTTFTYQVCDLGTPALCATATATIEVLLDLNGTANNEPNAQDDAFSGTGTNTITGNILPNDSDLNGDILTVNTTPVVNVPLSEGTLVLNSNGSFTFTPASGFTGTTSFVYQICDNGSPSLCDEATVYITVFNCALTAGSCVPQNDECQLHQGLARIQAQGGKLPYSVTWTPADGTTVQPAQILIDGDSILIEGLHGNTAYLFIVTDTDGCQVP